MGRCKGRQKPSPSPGSVDVRATPGSLSCHSQRVWSLLLPRQHFQALRDHVYSYKPGKRQNWPLDRNTSVQPGVYFKSWLVPGSASDRAAALSAAATFIYSPRKTGRGFSNTRGCLSADCRFLQKAWECQREFMGRGAVNRGAPRPSQPQAHNQSATSTQSVKVQ